MGIVWNLASQVFSDLFLLVIFKFLIRVKSPSKPSFEEYFWNLFHHQTSKSKESLFKFLYFLYFSPSILYAKIPKHLFFVWMDSRKMMNPLPFHPAPWWCIPSPWRNCPWSNRTSTGHNENDPQVPSVFQIRHVTQRTRMTGSIQMTGYLPCDISIGDNGRQG